MRCLPALFALTAFAVVCPRNAHAATTLDDAAMRQRVAPAIVLVIVEEGYGSGFVRKSARPSGDESPCGGERPAHRGKAGGANRPRERSLVFATAGRGRAATARQRLQQRAPAGVATSRQRPCWT